MHDTAPPVTNAALLRELATPPPQVEILGVPLALTTYDRTLSWIDAMVASRRQGYVCVAATHTVMVCQEDEELRDAVLGSSLTVPDGQPLVWAMNLLGHQQPNRVYGPTLMERHCEHAAENGTRVYLYGGRDRQALDRLARELRRRFPSLRIVGGWSPPYRPLSAAEDDAIVDEINRSGADVVWVGIGVPKQEKWMARMRSRLDAPVLVGVGAAFDFHAGLVPQAPHRIQSLGLEWAFRLLQEPRRLWRRYARYNPLFVRRFTSQLVRQRMSGRRTAPLVLSAPPARRPRRGVRRRRPTATVGR
ncbi:MAG: WecB/TagA/CpsF family glycosyltransferase [Solirubrobacteraceae bacterium]|nr:WecB/TagA/CpsF family glycosyltransferase [Solirubrobacteraceae bacterium]